jgi:hypothetical protein
MLLSPARLDGQRGRLLLRSEANFELARRLRSGSGAPIAEVFSFVSGLYFRGKADYANAFAQSGNAGPGAFVMTAGGGLCPLDESVDIHRLARWSEVSIREDNPHFTAPLYRHASELAQAHDTSSRFVLLGSVATKKYVAPLLDVFGERLLFPTEFLGRGDMSRGAMLLRAVRERRELDYGPVMLLGEA